MNNKFQSKNRKDKVMCVRDEYKFDKQEQNYHLGKDKRLSNDDNRKKGYYHLSRQSYRSICSVKSCGSNHRNSGHTRNNISRFDYDMQPRINSPFRILSRISNKNIKSDHSGDISEKSYIDPEKLRRQRMEETRVYGRNSCYVLFKNRPECIVRAWFIKKITPHFHDVLHWLATNRKAYHVVEEAELKKVSGTEHHGGVCFLTKKRMSMSVNKWLETRRDRDCVLALENIGNPHNIGSIMRNSAYFGVKGLLVNDIAVLESGAAVRTAEGGAEHIQALSAEDFIIGLKTFHKSGYTIITTSSHTNNKDNMPLTHVKLPSKIVLVLGKESDGLTEAALKQGSISVSINGTGKVESLNVSVATGILLAEWWRQNH